MKYLFRGLLLVVASMLASCSDNNKATIIQFSENEVSTEPYMTRMILTPGYLRIDDGNDDSGFVLLDRNKQVIYSVNTAEERILVIAKLDIPGKDDSLVNEAKLQKDTPPKVAGKEVKHYLLTTNKKTCYRLFAARGLLPDAVKALQQYRRILAGEHAKLAANTPTGMRDDCDYANNAVQYDRHLQHGFPVLTIDMTGRKRQLLGFKESQKVDSGLFQLPDGYKTFSTQPGAADAS